MQPDHPPPPNAAPNGDSCALPFMESGEFAECRVLVVDDSLLNRTQIRRFLQRDGIQVFEAKSGEDALWLAKEADPDLILMDVLMEGMDGYQTCELIRAETAAHDIPIIFLTGLGEREDVVRGFAVGAVDYITKPFHVAEGMSRIRTHLRLRKLSRFRQQHIQELKDLNSAKDRLLRVASHDLRNPLAAIVGLAEFLLESPVAQSADEREMIENIHQAAVRMAALLTNLLDLSALDSGKLRLKHEPLDLAAVAREVSQLYWVRAANKQIQLINADDRHPVWVLGDAVQLQRVLDNLVSNALKFTPAGGSVTISCVCDNGIAQLRVDDTGPGIPAADRAGLFKEFAQTRNQATAGEPGSGLGLSICQRLVDSLGGTISHDNLEGGGSRFTVSLPARNPA
jgi:two-component system, sensor histidine kinase and response regulator